MCSEINIVKINRFKIMFLNLHKLLLPSHRTREYSLKTKIYREFCHVARLNLITLRDGQLRLSVLNMISNSRRFEKHSNYKIIIFR